MKTYVIITSGDVSSVDFSKVQETSADTLKYNRAGTKTFVKYNGDKPAFLDGKTEYNIEEILAILNDPEGEWFEEHTTM